MPHSSCSFSKGSPWGKERKKGKKFGWKTKANCSFLQTHNQNLNGSDNVHGCRESCSDVEEYPNGSTKLGTQWPRDHEIWPSPRNYAIRCNGTHRDRCEHRLKTHKDSNKFDTNTLTSFIPPTPTHKKKHFFLSATRINGAIVRNIIKQSPFKTFFIPTPHKNTV